MFVVVRESSSSIHQQVFFLVVLGLKPRVLHTLAGTLSLRCTPGLIRTFQGEVSGWSEFPLLCNGSSWWVLDIFTS